MTQTDPALLSEAVAMCHRLNHPGDDEADLLIVIVDVARHYDLPWSTVMDAFNASVGLA